MQIVSLDLVSKVATSTGAVELTFEPRRPFAFRAGQGGLFQVEGGGAKPFTISSDSRSGQISLATTLQSQTRFKQALGGLGADGSTRIVGPLGVLPIIDPSTSQVLISQGIGITPFLSMARSARVPHARLLHVGVPHFFAETAERVHSASHLDHREELGEAINREIAERPEAKWTISGRRAFVRDVAARLVSGGIPRGRVHRDTFWGLGPSGRSVPSTTPTLR